MLFESNLSSDIYLLFIIDKLLYDENLPVKKMRIILNFQLETLFLAKQVIIDLIINLSLK